MLDYKFKYTTFGPYKRPVIPITLRHDTHEFNYLALIDSGSDLNIFHSDLAKILNIDLKKLKKIEFGGIHKGAKGIGYQCVLEIGINHNFFNVPVILSPNISGNGFGILGQQGFFHLFQVVFDYAKGDIRLTTK